jgi:hypothetical protein
VVVYAVVPRTEISAVVRAGLKLPQPSTVIAFAGGDPETGAQLLVSIGSVDESPHAVPIVSSRIDAMAPTGCCEKLRRIW